jgi:hypothetical protein
MVDVKLDSGILQYVPKGAYYEGTDQQFATVKDIWDRLLSYDRVLFSLLSMLNGSHFSKGMISHLLLSNPNEGKGMITKDDPTPLVPAGLPDDFEKSIILFNLEKIAEDSMPRALKNLLILTGSDSNAKRVNNSRTRSIILDFIFNRDNRQLDALAVNYKTKLAKLVRHALGKQDLYNILNHNEKLFQKLIGRYNRNSYPIVHFLFGNEPALKEVAPYFPQVEAYLNCRTAAQSGDPKEFKKYMKKLPWRTVIGFRNTYKLDIEKSEILASSKMSDRDLMQTQTAQKRAGAKTVRAVNYKKQDLYDLWKLYYHKILNNDGDQMDNIAEALHYIDSQMDIKLEKMDFGNVAVVVDMSHSMRGSDERPLHPMLTSMCLLSTISNIKTIHMVSGKRVNIEGTPHSALVPNGSSPLWKGLMEAVSTGAKTIIVISDGYENAVKGMFNHVYKHYKDSGKEFDVIHINPVFSSDATAGTARALIEGDNPLPVANYKHLETEFIFRKMLDHTEMVKQLLIGRYQKLIGGEV